VNNTSRTIFQLSRNSRHIIAFDSEVPPVNALNLGNLFEYRQYQQLAPFKSYCRLLVTFRCQQGLSLFNTFFRSEAINSALNPKFVFF